MDLRGSVEATGSVRAAYIKEQRCWQTGAQLSAGDVLRELGLEPDLFTNAYRVLRRESDGLGVFYTDGAGRRHKLYTWGDVPLLAKRVAACGETETRTLTGRRRMDVQRLTDRLNCPVQGTAADDLKLALAQLWERRDECPGAVPVITCHDEVVVECDADKAEEAKEWLDRAMNDGMDAVVNFTEPHILIEVESSASKTWGG